MDSCLNICLRPASFLEMIAFNPKEQFEPWILKEIVARVVALIAPIFYLYQTLCHVLSIAFYCVATPCLGAKAINNLFSEVFDLIYTAIDMCASVCEIPQKVIFGPHLVPNYSDSERRYQKNTKRLLG